MKGIRTLHANILAGNHRMIQFARWLGMSIRFSLDDRMLLKGSKDL